MKGITEASIKEWKKSNQHAEGAGAWISTTTKYVGGAGAAYGLYHLCRELTGEEKDKEKFFKYKGQLSDCLLEHTNAESTTKIPSVCKEFLHQYKTVATAEQVAAATQCLQQYTAQS